MRREPFYSVKEEAYLFPAISRKAGDALQPEDTVRQWCAFELIRAYGIPIGELEFEVPVKVGSKTYRIDILVRRDGQPWIVVECKEPRHAKPADGMAQAISYADAQGIKAPFAVYTNGEVWQVKRRVNDQWLPVVDLPRRVADQTHERFTEHLRALQWALPLLHKLDDSVQGAEAQTFLDSLQSFFNSGNLLLDGVEPQLAIATDHLLRVIICGEPSGGYAQGKLTVATNAFESYRQAKGLFGKVSEPLGKSSAEDLQYLHAILMEWVEESRGISNLDLLVLRVGVALTDYARKSRGGQQSDPALPSELVRAIWDFLNASLTVNLNSQLPDRLDRVLMSDLQEYCRPAWEQQTNQERWTICDLFRRGRKRAD